jgi:hypothetical protein
MAQGPKLGIYSKHILLFTEKYPVRGIVIVQDDIITDVIRLNESQDFDAADYPNI